MSNGTSSNVMRSGIKDVSHPLSSDEKKERGRKGFGGPLGKESLEGNRRRGLHPCVVVLSMEF